MTLSSRRGRDWPVLGVALTEGVPPTVNRPPAPAVNRGVMTGGPLWAPGVADGGKLLA